MRRRQEAALQQHDAVARATRAQFQRSLQADQAAADHNEVGIEHRVVLPETDMHGQGLHGAIVNEIRSQPFPCL